MIRSDKEYRVARTRLDETKQAIVQQRIEYAEMGLDIATANMFIGSTLAQQQQIQDEIVEYENARAFKALTGLTMNHTIGGAMTTADEATIAYIADAKRALHQVSAALWAAVREQRATAAGERLQDLNEEMGGIEYSLNIVLAEMAADALEVLP